MISPMNQRLLAEIGRTQRLEIVNSLKRTKGMSVNELVEKMAAQPRPFSDRQQSVYSRIAQIGSRHLRSERAGKASLQCV